jgi:hypothetical protein
MPTISAKIIKHPRKQRDCDTCLKPIIGETARLYGCGMEGDPLYVMYLHPACVTGISALRKLQAAQQPVAADGGYCVCQPAQSQIITTGVGDWCLVCNRPRRAGNASR